MFEGKAINLLTERDLQYLLDFCCQELREKRNETIGHTDCCHERT